jgi:hypothetical protein
VTTAAACFDPSKKLYMVRNPNYDQATDALRYLTDPAKRPRLHADLADATLYLSMNMTVAPFDDIHIRKAVNWVLDRQALLQAHGGPQVVQVATHAIPPAMLNGRLGADYNPYASRATGGTRPRRR